MLLTGTYTETFTSSCLDLVPWTTLKAHLKLNSDTEQSLVEVYLCGAVSYCEQYTGRALAAKEVTMYYMPPNDIVTDIYTLQLRYYIDTDGITTIMVTDADGNETEITEYQIISQDGIQIDASALPTGWLMLTVVYAADCYSLKANLVPAILMKVGEMYVYREDTTLGRNTSIISILNRHRIKRHT